MKRHLAGIIPLVCLVPTVASQAEEQVGDEQYQPVSNSETYTVQSGDTLWDISANVLQNPWYWPKIWSYNPEITNPHMIYPGDTIRFTQPNGNQLPTMATMASRQMDMGDDAADKNAAGSENQVSMEIINGQSAVSKRKPGTVQVIVESLMTQDELEDSGVIYKSAEERILLVANDKVYLRFPAGHDVSIGEQFLIYRTVEQIKHPVSKEKVGYLTQITGMLEVTNVSEKIATAIIKRGSNIIERGQFVMPLVKDSYRLVEPKNNQNETEIRGVVLATKLNENQVIGEQEIVFIDKGKNDGVEVGNTFTAVYRGDPLFGVDEALPEESIATLRVVDVKDKFCSAVVINAIRELDIGAEVAMKPW